MKHCAFELCQREFSDDAHPQKKYCSRTCKERAKQRRQWPRRTLYYTPVDHALKPCAECGEMFKPRNVRQKNCSDQCIAAARRTHERKGKKHRSSTLRRQSRAYKALMSLTCEVCGYTAIHRCQLDVHHRDEDHTNNKPDNLMVACANCHRFLHQLLMDRRKIVDTG